MRKGSKENKSTSKTFTNNLEGFTSQEKKLFATLNTPGKAQDFLNTIPFNFELDGNATLKSPARVLRTNSAHCFEGAIFGAYILSLHGHKPLVMTLKATKNDFDHVIAPFQVNGLWGALSKTNHAVLRYREPLYRDLRELVMSYFHEYFLDDGTKTLREYSEPLNLNEFENDWMISEGDLWGIDEELDKAKHYKIVPPSYTTLLRKADPIERKAGEIVQERKGGRL